MKNILTAIFCFSFFCAAAQKQLVVDPNAEIRELSGSFSSIKVSSAITVYLSKGAEEAIAVSAADDKYKSSIKTDIENGVLHIYYAERMHYRNNPKIKVYVSYINLEQIVATNSSDVAVAGVLELPLLNVQLSGASALRGELNIAELNARLSGASDMKLSGTAKNVNIESSGASDVKGYDFTAENCNVKLSGASDVDITVSKALSADAAGASDVHFKGNAVIKMQRTSGASSIAKVEQ